MDSGSLLNNLNRVVEAADHELTAMRCDTVLSDNQIDAVLTGAPSISRDIAQTDTSLFQKVHFQLLPDTMIKMRDAAGRRGLALGENLVSDYAQKCRLIPTYEKTLAAYRGQSKLQQLLIAELESTIEIKDKKITSLGEMGDLLQDNAKLYKTISEIRQGTWWERCLRTIAFPAGLAIGVVVGANLPK